MNHSTKTENIITFKWAMREGRAREAWKSIADVHMMTKPIQMAVECTGKRTGEKVSPMTALKTLALALVKWAHSPLGLGFWFQLVPIPLQWDGVGQSGHSENQVVDSNNLHRKHFETGNFLN
jgi:hypothetical protein